MRKRREQIILSANEVGAPDKKPMFLEKVYPYPVIDKIYDEKVTKLFDRKTAACGL